MADIEPRGTTFQGWTSSPFVGEVGPRGLPARSIINIDQSTNGSLTFNMSEQPLTEGPFVAQFIDENLIISGTNNVSKFAILDETTNVIFKCDTVTPNVVISSDAVIEGALTLDSNAIVRSLIPFGVGYDLGSMSKRFSKLYTTNISDTGAGVIVNNLSATGNLVGSSTTFTGNLVGEVVGNMGTTVVNNIGIKSSLAIQIAIDAVEGSSEFNDADSLVLRDEFGSTSVTNLNASSISGLATGQIIDAVDDVESATSSAVSNTLVKRDADGDIDCRILASTYLTGTLTSSFSGDVEGTQDNIIVTSVGGKTADQIAASVDATLAGTVTLTGDVTGSSNSNVVEFVGSKSSVEIADSVDLTDGATSSYNLNNLVLRDAFGGAEFNQLLASSIVTEGFTIDNVAETHSLTITESPIDKFVISYDTNPVMFFNDGFINCDTLLPSIAGVSNLGADGSRWAELYTTNLVADDNDVRVYCPFVPAVGDTHILGSTGLEWDALFVNNIKNGVTNLMSFSSTQIEVKKDIIPTSGVDLGSSGSRFANLYTDSLTDDGSQISCVRTDNVSEAFFKIEGSVNSWPLAIYRPQSSSNFTLMTFFSDVSTGSSDTTFGGSSKKQLTISTSGSIYANNSTAELGNETWPFKELHTTNIKDDGNTLQLSNLENLRIRDTPNPTLTIHNTDTSIVLNDKFGKIDFRSSGNYFGTYPNGLSCGYIEMSQRWSNAWIRAEMDFYVVDQSPGTTYNAMTLDYQGNTVTRHHKPMSDNTYDIGSSSTRWDDVYATNSTIQTSDKTKKRDIKTSSLGLDFINRLEPVSYKWKDYTKKELVKGELVNKTKTHTRTHYGLIAQQVKKVLDDVGLNTVDFAGFIRDDQVVNDYDKPRKDKPEDTDLDLDWNEWETKEETNFGLRYTEFISPMLKAIQELSEQNTQLIKRLDKLDKQVNGKGK